MQKGSRVEEFQKICEVQSDKAAVEITSRYAGVIKQLYHSPGDLVQVSGSCEHQNFVAWSGCATLPLTQVGSPLVDIEVTQDNAGDADPVKEVINPVVTSFCMRTRHWEQYMSMNLDTEV